MKPATTISAIVFVLIAVAHLLRLMFHVQIIAQRHNYSNVAKCCRLYYPCFFSSDVMARKQRLKYQFYLWI